MKKEAITVGPNLTRPVSLKGENLTIKRDMRCARAGRDQPVKRQQEGGLLRAEERGLRGHRPCRNLDLELAAFRTGRRHIASAQPARPVAFYYCSPSRRHVRVAFVWTESSTAKTRWEVTGRQDRAHHPRLRPWIWIPASLFSHRPAFHLLNAGSPILALRDLKFKGLQEGWCGNVWEGPGPQ